MSDHASTSSQTASSRPRSPRPSESSWTLERLLVERSITLGFALGRTTQATYSSALDSYLSFCSLHHLDPQPTVDTFSFYITFISHHIEPRSVRTHLASIVSELEPFYPSVRDVRRAPLVARTLRGSLRRFSSPVRQKIPLIREDLLFVLHSLPSPLGHDDLLFVTLLLSGFFGLLRLGELVQPDRVGLRSFANVSWRHAVRLNDNFFGFAIPRSKGDTFFEGDHIIIQKSEVGPDPLALFRQYLSSRDTMFSLFPQLWLRSDGSVPSRSWFLGRLHVFFPHTVSGHSMRAGGAISLAAAGVPLSQIQAVGRWKPDTFERYIRHHPALLQAVLFHGRPVHDSPLADTRHIT